MTSYRWLRHAAVSSTILASVVAGMVGVTQGAAATPQRAAQPSAQPAPYRIVAGNELEPKPTPEPVPPPWVLPVSSYELTGQFGDAGYTWSSAHTGLDFAAPSGTPMSAISDGVVTEAGWDDSYGYKTVIRLSDGTEVWYCHQDSLSVGVGQQLAAGEVLGYVGSSGNVTGSHLHLEVHQGGAPVDPYAVLAGHGITP